jgi:hypothetical protein
MFLGLLGDEDDAVAVNDEVIPYGIVVTAICKEGVFCILVERMEMFTIAGGSRRKY